jgi:hypothetical protein
MLSWQNESRRSFLWSFASLGLFTGFARPDNPSEKVRRFLISGCEIRMSVQFFGSSAKEFRFRDQLSDRSFCLSANGEENRDCLQQFSGSIAVAYYHFHPRRSSASPLFLRERVLTIDHDSHMDPRPPFERRLPVQQDMVSDIQAFGYDPNAPASTKQNQPSMWCLLRQDLYLADQDTPFLIVHWKHSVDSIQLLDVIPGEDTKAL